MKKSGKGKKKSKTAKELALDIRAFFFREDHTRTLSTTKLGKIYVVPSFKAKKETLEAGILWLETVFEPVLRSYLAVRMIHPEDVWAGFNDFFIGDEGVEDSEECAVMAKRQDAILTTWLKRPAILRKTKLMGEVK